MFLSLGLPNSNLRLHSAQPKPNTQRFRQQKELIPLHRLIDELTKALGVEQSAEERLSCVFEDNRGALTLANTEMPMTTPRTKHYAIELHWFREHCVPGAIEVKAIDTKVQLADIFTKGLDPQDFETKRRLVVGW